MKHGGVVGTYDKMVGKRAQDIDPKKRSLALRAIAGDRESDSAGVVCWVLTTVEKNIKVHYLYKIKSCLILIRNTHILILAIDILLLSL